MPELQQIGKYEIQGDPQKGGMGSVYTGIDPVLNRKVAIKMLHKHLSDGPGFRERFFREAQILAKLKHQNITQIYEADENEDGLYLTMEYVEGQTLDDMIFQGKYRTLQAALPVIRQICEALDYAHRQGIVHRDIKPSNIMINANGEAMLMDFGIAKPDTDSALTQDGSTLGTPQYMSPEQCKGEPVTYRSDIYSLAVVVYELLTGTRPIEGENALSIINKQVNDTPPPITTRNTSLPKHIAAAIAVALSKDPNNRQQSALEFYRQLQKTEINSAASNKKAVKNILLYSLLSIALIGLFCLVLFAVNNNTESSDGTINTGPIQTKPNPINEKLKQANEFYEQDKFGEALSIYKDIWSNGERDYDYLMKAASCCDELANISLDSKNNTIALEYLKSSAEWYKRASETSETTEIQQNSAYTRQTERKAKIEQIKASMIPPEPLQSIQICSKSGLRAGSKCRNKVSKQYAASQIPRYCSKCNAVITKAQSTVKVCSRHKNLKAGANCIATQKSFQAGKEPKQTCTICLPAIERDTETQKQNKRDIPRLPY